MKKIVCFGLCFMIVLCSFVLCFADSSVVPVILPIGSSTDYSIGYQLLQNNSIRFLRSDNLTYFVPYSLDGNSVRFLLFSDNPNTSVFANYLDSTTLSSWALVNQYNGFYYTTGIQPDLDSSVLVFYDENIDSVTDIIDYFNDSVFSTSFSLSYLVNGSVSWLSSMAQAVKSSGLLLFIVLFSFVGIGIGLLRRFTNG